MQTAQESISKVYRARALRDGLVLRLPGEIKPGTMFVVKVDPITGIVTACPCEIVPKQPGEVVQI